MNIHIQFVVICVTIVVLFLLVNNFLDKYYSNDGIKNFKKLDAFPHSVFSNNSKDENKSQLLFDHCSFRRLDPWDPLLAKELRSNYDPLKNCEIKYKQLTRIENNSVIIDPDLAECECLYRCLLTSDDLTMDIKNWTLLQNGTEPDCDVIQIKCFNQSVQFGVLVNELAYQFMHTLIYRNKSNLTPPDAPEMPRVHVIILDSVSFSQFQRSMVRTSTFLRDILQAQQMKHLNKVGFNSRPNSYAFLLGKALDSIPKSPFSRGYPSDFPRDPCGDWLDNDQFIGFRYKDAGYVTYMAEDWAYGVFNWPNCVGFKTKPTDHYMRPFQLYLQAEEEAVHINNIMENQTCKEGFKYIFEYYQQFLDTYRDRSTFSINWMADLAHDNINGLYHADDYFYRFFLKNEEIFNNSYVFFMSDHGNRFHTARDTWVGEVEDNNPALWISVPRDKRTPEVLKQLEENSKKLITHYDVYATLNSLVEPMNPRNASEDVLLHGENLLGPLREPRTCDRLRIPFEFCSCDFGKTEFPKNDNATVEIANHCIDKINEILQSNNETASLCARISLDTSKSVTAKTFTAKSNLTIYQVSWVTTPGIGVFSATVIKEANGDISIVSQMFPRFDPYADQAECVRHAHYASYCYCKNLLNVTTGASTTETLSITRNTVL